MKKIFGIILFCLGASSANNALAQQSDLIKWCANDKGTVNFDVLPLDIKHSKYQEVSLFGCNNTIKKVHDLEWGMKASRELECGWQEKDGKRFYVSQYYLASPPVPVPSKPTEMTTIGLLHPDKFRFEGSNPSEEVILDYRPLEPTYLSYVKVDYASCAGKVDIIPINTSCPKFPSKKGGNQFASGIGVLKNKQGHRQIFLPTIDEKGKEPLQCNVAILNDIQLDYEIGFELGDLITDKLNLTYHFTSKPGEPLTLVCEKRPKDELPSGCAPFGVEKN